MHIAVKLVNVSKTFTGGIRAVDDVSFELGAGKLYGLVGPNGAGKSTLTNLIAGYVVPDTGDIYANGFPVVGYHQAMTQCGVVKVEQHPNLAPLMSPAEHLDLLLPNVITGKRLLPRCVELLREIGVTVSLREPVESLPIGQQRAFEIVKALIQCELIASQNVNPILILDETTAYLPGHLKESLKNKLRKLVSDGYTIIMISHDLQEVRDISDEILVMTGGKIVARFTSSNLNMVELVGSMFETTHIVDNVIFGKEVTNGSPALLLDNVSVKDDRGYRVIDELNLKVTTGEIRGIAAIPGTGEKELAEAIYGLRKVESGKILIFGKETSKLDVDAIRKMGVRLLSDDKIREGLIYDGSVIDNLTIGMESDYSLMRGKFIDTQRRIDLAKRLTKEFSIKVKNLQDPIFMLSGGNMQRVYLARVLGQRPRLLIALHPTVGLDPMGTNLFYQKINELRRNGLTSLIFSPDIKGLITLCDRISVLRNGKIIATFSVRETNVETLGMLLSGVG
jgi:simple sugar transport system ATP-binding protein